MNTAISDELMSKSETLEKMSDNYQRLQHRVSNLHEVHNLRAKELRAPGQRFQAAGSASGTSRVVGEDTYQYAEVLSQSN